MDALLGIVLDNIVETLVILLLGAIIHVFRRALKRLVEKKYPIEGTYLTTYEDIENNKTIIRSALAELEQSGKKIKGKTFLSNNRTRIRERTWELKGELKDGYIRGKYDAEYSVDKGFGNFFLKVENDRRMHGSWAGYDSENNIVGFGKYTFIPILEGYSIVEAQKEHRTHIIDIANKELGDNFLDHEEIMDKMLSDNSYICKVALSKSDDILGFCLCKIVDQSEICDYLRIDQTVLPPYVKSFGRIGILKTLAVQNKKHRRGVGHALTVEAHDDLIKRDIQAMASIAWKSGEKINAGGILKAVGLESCAELKSYWKDDSIDREYKCPICGKPPCKCSAVLYFKAV